MTLFAVHLSKVSARRVKEEEVYHNIYVIAGTLT